MPRLRAGGAGSNGHWREAQSACALATGARAYPAFVLRKWGLSQLLLPRGGRGF